jgi:hypothetical protein
MSTLAEKKALNVQRVQKSVAKSMALMNDEEKVAYKLKKKEIDRKGHANYVAKKARLAEEATNAAVAEKAQALFDSRNEEAIEAAVNERAHALYETEMKEKYDRDVIVKAMAIAQAMIARANNATVSNVGNT